MSEVEDRFEKENALNEKMKAQGMLGGREAMRTGRPDIRERVSDQMHRAHADAQRATRLSELDHLLTKHPDVARILDLMEDVRG